jgi:hypothetical protein
MGNLLDMQSLLGLQKRVGTGELRTELVNLLFEKVLCGRFSFFRISCEMRFQVLVRSTCKPDECFASFQT